ncbi:MAG: Smr/MutS family protein [Treponema sp.]|nr:Smr/MutS family protein [Treponema sp.]
MDFGEILDKWERRSGSGAPSQKSGANAMENWLQKNNVYDKDADAEKMSKPGKNRQRLLRSEPNAILDIHGQTSEQAKLTLESFFASAREKGHEKLRIIHGKGNHTQGEAVLGSVVRDFIEKCPFAGQSGYEKSPNGGSGATWVLLKNGSGE